MLVASADCKVDIDAEREMPAKRSLAELHDQLRSLENELTDITMSLAAMDPAFGQRLEKYKKHLESDLSLSKVYLNTRTGIR